MWAIPSYVLATTHQLLSLAARLHGDLFMLALQSASLNRHVGSPKPDSGDGKALDEMSICSRVKLGAHSWP